MLFRIKTSIIRSERALTIVKHIVKLVFSISKYMWLLNAVWLYHITYM